MPSWCARSSRLAVLGAVLVVGCASAPASDVAPPRTAPVRPLAPPGVSGELILTRQRDLLDRGMITARLDNRSASSLLLEHIRLDADSFDADPAADRTISVRSGRRVAIQVPYGTVDECAAGGPITARLTFTFTSADDPTPRDGVVELEGTDLLAVIRAEQCVGRRVADGTVMTFSDPRIVDGRLVTDLVIEPTGDTTGLSVTGVRGTILVSVRTPAAWSGTDLHDTVTIPLEFVVNRCDPHALAEVTKRYGLELAVSRDGADPVDVGVDIEPLVGLLGVIVEQCRTSSGTG